MPCASDTSGKSKRCPKHFNLVFNHGHRLDSVLLAAVELNSRVNQEIIKILAFTGWEDPPRFLLLSEG